MMYDFSGVKAEKNDLFWKGGKILLKFILFKAVEKTE